jgi:hypothetical protein
MWKLAAILTSLVCACDTALAAGENVSDKWTAPISLPLLPSSGAVLPLGNLLLWAADGEVGFGSGTVSRTVLLDPQTLAKSAMTAYAGHNMFCTGTTNLEDGRILVNGGSQSNITSIFDPAGNSFSRVQGMKVPRNYHSIAFLLPDGRILSEGGA